MWPHIFAHVNLREKSVPSRPFRAAGDDFLGIKPICQLDVQETKDVLEDHASLIK
jgi:hypothetical protein